MAEETRHREESKLICGLARGLSHVQAAQEAGVSIRTAVVVVAENSDDEVGEAVAVDVACSADRPAENIKRRLAFEREEHRTVKTGKHTRAALVTTSGTLTFVVDGSSWEQDRTQGHFQDAGGGHRRSSGMVRAYR